MPRSRENISTSRLKWADLHDSLPPRPRSGGWLGVGECVVSMSAKDFTYLPDRNILLTKMTKEQVKKMTPIKENG